MTTKSKTKQPASKSKKTTNTSKKAAPQKAAQPKVDTTPLPDPCADGHQWDTDGEGVEHCKVCLADRNVIEKPAKTSKPKQPKSTEQITASADGKLSAIDAAAKVLFEAGEPLNAKQMIEAMATKGYWTSPGGKTPHATLYSSIIREISVKGSEARFVKTERGKFQAKS